MKKLLEAIFLVCGLMLIMVVQARASLLTNGDFETGNLTGWTWTPDLQSEPTMTATVVPYSGSYAFRVNPGNDSGGGSPEKGGTLSQLVQVTSGMTYNIEGGLLAIADLGTVNADGGTITASIGGSTLHTFDVGEIDDGQTITDSFFTQYVATTTGSLPFELRFTRGYMNYTPVIYHYVDNLDIAVIPIPTTIFLLFSGLIGLAGFRRKFRSS